MNLLKIEKKCLESSFEVENNTIKVKSKLSTLEKESIIKTCLGGCFNSDNTPSRLLYDTSLYAIIVLKYTDVEIDGMENMSLFDLYDILETNEIIQKTLNCLENISKGEINELLNYADVAYEELLKQLVSASSAINSLVVGITESMASSAALQKTVDKQQLQQN